MPFAASIAAVKTLAILFASVLPALSAAGPPEVAVGFLEKVRAGKVNLEPDADTAISAATQPEKRREITRRLERTALDLDTGELKAVADRAEGNLAAVIVRKESGFDPARLRVFAVALVRKGDQWRPAPVPGSFENTGIGFDPGVRKQAADLERWMLEERTKIMESARDQLTNRMREDILTAIRPEDVRAMTAAQAGAGFLDACAKARAPVALGLLGGLQASLPDNWSARLQQASAALAAPRAATRPWRLLVAPEVIRTVIHEEGDDTTGQISLACVDPTGPKSKALPRIEIIDLDLRRSPDGIWRVDPPRGFLEAAAPTNEPPNHNDADDDDDGSLLASFPERLRETYPLKPAATCEDAVKAAAEALRAPTPLPLIGMLDLSGPKRTARAGCLKAVDLWASLHNPANLRSPVALDSVARESTGAASFQIFSVRDDRLDLRVLYFEKGESGWHLLSGMAPDDLCRDRFAAETEWAAAEAKRWPETWRAKLLADSPVIDPAKLPAPPARPEIEKLLDRWFDVLASGNLSAALRLTSRLGSNASPARLLRNLGYEINSLRKCTGRPTITAVATGKTWSVAAVRFDQGEKPVTAVYPVVSGSDGPKILLETDLFVSEDRARGFLNKSSFGHLRENAPEAVAAELEDLFKQLGAAPAKP